MKVLQDALQRWRGAPKKLAGDLTGGGERVDIDLRQAETSRATFDLYQHSHYKRYEFACQWMTANMVIGDFACGTGYGTVMLAQQGQRAVGADINAEVVASIRERYTKNAKVEFLVADLLGLTFVQVFDVIVSFETIEHFNERKIGQLLSVFSRALKPGGQLILSTPFQQTRSRAAIKLGFHQTFDINEPRLTKWLATAGFKINALYYQNYQTHIIQADLDHKDFVICLAQKAD